MNHIFNKPLSVKLNLRRVPIGFILLATFVLGSTGIRAQDRSLEIIGTAEYKMKPLSGANVTLYKNGAKDKTAVTGSKGEFNFSLDMNSEYKVEINKTGFLAKSIAFNTELPDDTEGKWTMEFAMSLYKGCEGVNTSVLNDPVDRIKFSTNKKDFISDEVYVSRMRGRMQNMMMDIERCESDKYKEALAEGDKLTDEGKFEEARAKFEEAMEIYPEDKIATKKLVNLEEEMGEEQLNKSQYSETISVADQLFAAGNYSAARAEYAKASSYQPQDTYAKEKLAAIDNMLQEQQLKSQASTAASEKAYTQAMTLGQTAFAAGNYEEAKKYFNQALAIKPEQSLPQQKLKETNKASEEAFLAKNRAEKEKAVEAMETALDNGDDYFSQKNYAAAEQAYMEALKIDPNDSYATQRLAKTRNLMASAAADKQQQLAKAYTESIASGDALLAAGSYQQAIAAYKQAGLQKPGSAEIQSKISMAEQKLAGQQQDMANQQAKRKQYDALIAKGNGLLAQQDYNGARAAYQNALNLMPGETVPQSKIREIDQLQASKQKEEQYRTLIVKADGLLASREYAQAKTTYEQALAIKSDDAYAQQKVNEINGVISANKKLQAEQAVKKQQYAATIAEADRLFAASQNNEAKAKYIEALMILPGEAYPQAQMTKIDVAIAAQLKLANDQKAKEQQYNGLISKGDAQMSAGDLASAKISYQQALALKASESYPREKISEIDGIAKNEADKLAAQNALNQKYDALIVKGDGLFGSKYYVQAKVAYEQALLVKTTDTYAQQKVSEINGIIAANNRLMAEQEAKKQQYNAVLAEADRLFSASQNNEARAKYQAALILMPGEAYPQAQLTKIEAALAAELKLANAQKAKEQQYASLISKGDAQLAAGDNHAAKISFQQALAIESTENYPRDKISEIDGILKRNAEQLAAQQALKQKYDVLIAQADGQFTNSQLDAAKQTYRNAQLTMPAESYASSQIAKIDGLLAAKAQEASEKAALAQKYKDAIDQGDRMYAQNSYSDAKKYYQLALSVKSAETYPASQIAKIDAQMAQMQKEQQDKLAFEQKYAALIATADANYDKRNYPSAKASYTQALQMKPGDTYPQQRLNKIAEFERIIAKQEADRNAAIAAAAVATTATTAKTAPPKSSKLQVLTFSTENERKNYLNSLRKDYPEGVTKEVHKEKNSTTERYVVIRDNEVREFRMVKFNWGGTEITLNGKPITSMYFNTQVKVRDGEFFQERNF